MEQEDKMDPKERERLELACRVCRETGSGGDQLLLIRLEDVEEYLKLEKIFSEALRRLNHYTMSVSDLKRMLNAEVMGTCEQEENSGEIESSPEEC